MSSIPPSEVTSPADKWVLDKVIFNGGDGECAVATGVWDTSPCLAIRWNGSDDRPLGMPQAYGNPTWFILPTDFGLSVASCIWQKLLLKDVDTDPSAARSIAKWLTAVSGEGVI